MAVATLIARSYVSRGMRSPPFEWIAIDSLAASSREICRWLFRTLMTKSMCVVLSFKISMPVVKPGGLTTCSPKTGPREMRVGSARMPAGRPRDEAQTVHRGADHRDPEGGRGRGEKHRPLPASRHQRADLLSLESQIYGPRG